MTHITVAFSVKNMTMQKEGVSKEEAKQLKKSFRNGGILILHDDEYAKIYHHCLSFLIAQMEIAHKGEMHLPQKIEVLCLDMEEGRNLDRHSRKVADCVEISKCTCSVRKNFQKFWKDFV